jgi:hypothetical protein
MAVSGTIPLNSAGFSLRTRLRNPYPELIEGFNGASATLVRLAAGFGETV